MLKYCEIGAVKKNILSTAVLGFKFSSHLYFMMFNYYITI